MRLVGIPAHEVTAVWSAVKDLIKIGADLSEGRITPETIWEDLKAKNLQLWCAVDDKPRKPRIVMCDRNDVLWQPCIEHLQFFFFRHEVQHDVYEEDQRHGGWLHGRSSECRSIRPRHRRPRRRER